MYFSFLNADFCCGSILISFGAVLGVLSPVQLVAMALLETVFYSVNEFVIIHIFEVRCVAYNFFFKVFFFAEFLTFLT